MKRLYLVVILVLLSGGCEKNKLVNETPQVNVYSYNAFDTTGIKIIQGWFEISAVDSSRIEGDWHLHKTADVGEIGPQTGDGRLIGNIYNNTVSINLNPDYVDNNIILRGPVLADVTEGEWHWITIAGVAKRGTYQAIREIAD